MAVDAASGVDAELHINNWNVQINSLGQGEEKVSSLDVLRVGALSWWDQ